MGITFCSGGVLQQMMALNDSTQPDLQNKTGLSKKYLKPKKLQAFEDVSQNGFFFADQRFGPISATRSRPKVSCCC